jgi:hypothetical protein
VLYLASAEGFFEEAGSAGEDTGELMREPQWMEWTRTTLQAPERNELLGVLTSEQKAQLSGHDYVWKREVGVIWKPVTGGLRRARFTHGTHFRTQHGEFYIDSEGCAQARSHLDEVQKLKAT